MENMIRIIYLLTIIFVFQGCDLVNKKATEVEKKQSPKNIILMIGDGMGLSQMYAANKVKKDNMNIVRCKYIGLVNTSSKDELITDSAASGTAMATGKKTNNKHISVSPDGKVLETILEIAEKHGLATGLVATSAITHATPASFIAHNTSRYNYEDIAYDFLETDIDIFIGGGMKHFADREDELNLIDSLKVREYNVVKEITALEEINKGKVAGLLYAEHPPKYSEGRDDFLERASIKAIEILNQDDDGFFLMIEGSQIDWAGHDNDQDYLLQETINFDNVVGKVLDFAENDGETLVIITADHECGGYTVIGEDEENNSIKGHFSSEDHTPVMIPLYAYGPGAEDFIGIYENTDIFNKMYRAFEFSSAYK